MRSRWKTGAARSEIDFLMRLLREYLRKEMPVIHRNNIASWSSVRPDQLPEAVRTDVERAMDQTAKNSGMQLAVALNYGGRAELVMRSTVSSTA